MDIRNISFYSLIWDSVLAANRRVSDSEASFYSLIWDLYRLNIYVGDYMIDVTFYSLIWDSLYIVKFWKWDEKEVLSIPLYGIQKKEGD